MPDTLASLKREEAKKMMTLTMLQNTVQLHCRGQEARRNQRAVAGAIGQMSKALDDAEVT